MTRTTAREIAVRISYALNMTKADAAETVDAFFDGEYFPSLAQEDEQFKDFPDKKQLRYIKELTVGVAERKEELDSYIQKYSKGWKLGRISRTAAAILRCAIYEVLYMDDVPDAAAINEAVELAKVYEEAETVSFINGVLGGFYRGELSGTESFDWNSIDFEDEFNLEGTADADESEEAVKTVDEAADEAADETEDVIVTEEI